MVTTAIYSCKSQTLQYIVLLKIKYTNSSVKIRQIKCKKCDIYEYVQYVANGE